MLVHSFRYLGFCFTKRRSVSFNFTVLGLRAGRTRGGDQDGRGLGGRAGIRTEGGVGRGSGRKGIRG